MKLSELTGVAAKESSKDIEIDPYNAEVLKLLQEIADNTRKV